MYLWRIRFATEKEWRPEVYLMGSDTALRTIRDALASMEVELKAKGESARKFLCNPPEDIDVVRIAHEHQAEMEWLIWLVIRLEQDVDDESQYVLKNKAVTVRYNEQTLNQFLKILEYRLDQPLQTAHVKSVPGGLYLASDWFEEE
jgi:hypothetical protein